MSLTLLIVAGVGLVGWGAREAHQLSHPDDKIRYMAQLERAGFESFRFGSSYAANRGMRRRNAVVAIAAGASILLALFLTASV